MSHYVGRVRVGIVHLSQNTANLKLAKAPNDIIPKDLNQSIIVVPKIISSISE